MFKKFAIIIMTLVICGSICGCVGNADVANANEVNETTTVNTEQNDYNVVMYEEDGWWHVRLTSRVDESIPDFAGCYNYEPSVEDLEEFWNRRIQNWNEFIGN